MKLVIIIATAIIATAAYVFLIWRPFKNAKRVRAKA